MEQFTIYCSPEQVKKALELGAHIKIVCPYTKINAKFDERVVVLSHSNVDSTNRTTYTLAETPTAEQMIGWIETSTNIESISIAKTIMGDWFYGIETKEHYLEKSNVSSRKEATISAIDAALDYLFINQKKLN